MCEKGIKNKGSEGEGGGGGLRMKGDIYGEWSLEAAFNSNGVSYACRRHERDWGGSCELPKARKREADDVPMEGAMNRALL